MPAANKPNTTNPSPALTPIPSASAADTRLVALGTQFDRLYAELQQLKAPADAARSRVAAILRLDPRWPKGKDRRHATPKQSRRDARQLECLQRAYDESGLTEHGGAHDEAMERLDDVAREISALPFSSLEGLAVKCRVLEYNLGFDVKPAGSIEDWDFMFPGEMEAIHAERFFAQVRIVPTAA